jgi:hypothetical protein
MLIRFRFYCAELLKIYIFSNCSRTVLKSRLFGKVVCKLQHHLFTNIQGFHLWSRQSRILKERMDSDKVPFQLESRFFGMKRRLLRLQSLLLS